MKAKRKMSSKKTPARQANIITSIIRFVIFLIIFLVVFSVFEILSFVIYPKLNSTSAEFYSSAALSLAFLVSAILYLLLVDKSNKSVIERLGLSRNMLTRKNLWIGLIIFAVLYALELALSLFSSLTGVTINTNVDVLLANAPIWFYVFTAFIAPINEEVLFRGLAVPRIGVPLSAIFFAIGHTAYNSTSYIPGPIGSIIISIVAITIILYSILKLRSWQWAVTIFILVALLLSGLLGVEVVSAFIFGMLGGYVYKKTGSLYPSMFAHMLTDALAVLSIFYS